MKYPWLYVGAKVVCVDAESRPAPGCGDFWNPLALNAVYVVTAIIPDPRQGHGIVVCLSGHPNPNLETGEDYGYSAGRFRPVLPDTSKQVEAMKHLMLDAKTRGNVNA
jgi:hypothetical protein